MVSFGWWSIVGSWRIHACNQVERSCFWYFVQGTIHGRYEGSFIDGTRDSKYDLHRHVTLPLQLCDGNNRDLNLLCIFILFLGVRRAIFLFSTMFPNMKAIAWSCAGIFVALTCQPSAQQLARSPARMWLRYFSYNKPRLMSGLRLLIGR